MKKLFLSLIILSMALPYLHAQTACDEVTTSTITLTKRPLQGQELEQECGNTYESGIAFYRVTPGVLPGIFTVAYNATTMKYSYVRFSKGNLQYLPSSAQGDSVWRFAEHQYDYIGANNKFADDALNHRMGDISGKGEIVPTDELWYDLFGFGTSGAAPYDEAHPQSHPLSTSKTNEEYINVSLTGGNARYDWGVYNKIFMGGDQPGQWRVLTNSQWAYLINTRVAPDGVSKLYCHGRIKIKDDSETHISGLFIFPDDFTDIDDPDNAGQPLPTTRGTCAYTANTFTLTQWEALEKVGVVFLPAAGYRDGIVLSGVNSYGRYWSSTNINATYAYTCYFGSGIMYPSSNNSKLFGFSVRLVQDFTK